MKNDWKGNVRELENVLERAAISSNSDILEGKNFKFLNTKNNTGSSFANLNGQEKLADIEISYIKKVLEENNWNKLKASQILGIDRKTLYKKIREYNLE